MEYDVQYRLTTRTEDRIGVLKVSFDASIPRMIRMPQSPKAQAMLDLARSVPGPVVVEVLAIAEASG